MAISLISLLLIGCNSNSNVKSESVKQEVKMNNVEKVSELKIEYTNGLNGWFKLEDGWHYFEKGYNKTGWIEDNNKKYYCDELGLKTGWHMIKNEWYYFSETGELLTSTNTPDGYTVDSNGHIV
ncbi:hypothetical protein [Clostridium sp. C2-6-12]|uniref:hypothetical protein n=1 Tax=Clostridium sp. C2-6-12 TaxID=2698832 RepID=UPI0013722534|nr:hypothetical protein [Clostridium sp. C2-6-12]